MYRVRNVCKPETQLNNITSPVTTFTGVGREKEGGSVRKHAACARAQVLEGPRLHL